MGTIFIDHNAAHKILRMFFLFFLFLSYNIVQQTLKSSLATEKILFLCLGAGVGCGLKFQRGMADPVLMKKILQQRPGIFHTGEIVQFYMDGQGVLRGADRPEFLCR